MTPQNSRKAVFFSFAKRPLIFGHRGCSKAAPENTLAAFRKLLEYGIPGVELDVQACKTGELVVMHDYNLKRTTGFDALVVDTPYAAIKELSAGGWFDGAFAGENVPLLDDVFDLLSDKVYYDIEIKHRNKAGGALEKSLTEMIIKRGLARKVIVSSFNPYALRAVRNLDGDILTALIYVDHPESPRILRKGFGRFMCAPHILKPERKQVSRREVFFKKKLEGYPLIPWTVDDSAEAKRLLQLGADGLISNEPEKLSQVRDYYLKPVP